MASQTNKTNHTFIRVPGANNTTAGYIKYGDKKIGWRAYDGRKRVIENDDVVMSRQDAIEWVLDEWVLDALH